MGCVMCVCTFKWIAVHPVDPYSRMVHPNGFMSLPSQKNWGESVEKLIKFHNSQRLGDELKPYSFFSEMGCVMCVFTFKWVVVHPVDPYIRIVYDRIQDSDGFNMITGVIRKFDYSAEIDPKTRLPCLGRA